MIERTIKVTVYLDQWGAPLHGSIELRNLGETLRTETRGCEPDAKPVTFFRRLANEGLALTHQNDAMSNIFKL